MATEALAAPAAPGPAPEAAEVEAEATAAPAVEAPPAEAEPAEAPEPAEGRPRRLKLTPEIREFFRRHPEVRDACFRGQRLAELFPDFRTAERAARALASLGGVEQMAAALEGG